ncbi:MAG: CoA transferase, partial [Paraburkholderia tropica]
MTLTTSPLSPPGVTRVSTPALQGLRVLDLTRLLPGPVAT